MVNHGLIYAMFQVLGRLFPATPLESLTSEPLSRIAARHKRLNFLGYLLFFSAFAVLGGMYAFLLAKLAATAQRDLPVEAQHIIRPGWFEFGFFATFLSMLSSGCFVTTILRLVLGRHEFAIFNAYESSKAPGRFDGSQACAWAFLVLFPPLAVISMLSVSWYTALTDRAVIDCPFGSPGTVTTRAYADIRGIYRVRGHHALLQDTEDPFFVIVFKDGSRWKAGAGGEVKFIEAAKVMVFVSGKSQVPITPIGFIEEIPR